MRNIQNINIRYGSGVPVPCDPSPLWPLKNLNHGTDENTNYIRQWETYKGYKATQCANHDCRNEKNNPALVGAHVIKSEGEDKSWYICPLCSKCNSDANHDDMMVNEIDLAPYNEIKDL